MQLLNRLHQQGFDVLLLDNNTIGIKPKDKLTPDLAKEIRTHKQEIIKLLQNQTKADGYDRSKTSQRVKSYCTRYQPPRFVSLEVCKWHIERADPKCLNCEHMNHEERKQWMDGYLNNAIKRLDSLYIGRDKIMWSRPEDKEKIGKIEKLITSCFLQGDVKGYIKAVNKWESCFKG